MRDLPPLNTAMYLPHLSAKSWTVCLLALVFALNTCYGQWTDLQTNVPNSVDVVSSQTALVGTTLYYFGGMTGASTVSTAAYALDLSKPGSVWKSIKALPKGRFGGYAGAVNGKVYIVAGAEKVNGAMVSLAQVYEYDPVADTYTEKAPLPSPVSYCCGGVVEQKVLVIGGSPTSDYKGAGKSCQVYDPALNVWTSLNDMPVESVWSASTVIGKSIYVVGGVMSTGKLSNLIYKGTISGSSITWSNVGTVDTPIYGASAGAMNDKLYLLGGSNGTYVSSEMKSFDIAAQQWKASYVCPIPGYFGSQLVGDGTACLYYYTGSKNTQTLKFVDGKPVPIAVFSHSEIADSIAVGTSGARRKTLYIENQGVLPLNVDVSTQTADTWVSCDGTSASLDPGQMMAVHVDMIGNELKAGTHRSSLSIATNDIGNGSVSIPLRLEVYNTVARHVVLCEMFTSGTCGPCNPGNTQFSSVMEKLPAEDFAIVKYQQSWPGNGDPYCTTETSTRCEQFYEISGIPELEVDGGGRVYPPFMTGDVLTASQASVSLLGLKSSHSIDPTTHRVDVQLRIEPLGDFASSSNAVFVAICEKHTTKNTKTNGESEFEHVVKKLLPNEGGTIVGALKTSTPVDKHFTYTFPGSYRLPADALPSHRINLATEHSVEDFNNLEVVVWVQDTNSHKVLNAANSVEGPTGVDVDLANAYTMQLADCAPNPVSGIATMKYYVPNNGRVSVDLVDITGTTVRNLYDGYKNNGEHSLFVSSSDLSNGVYQVVLRSNNKAVSRSFVVAH